MKKKNEEEPQIIQPDLKHDTMEYAASADGDDELDLVEEDDITASELNALEEDNEKDEIALNTAAADSVTDEDNFLAAPEEADEYEEDQTDEVDI